MLLTALNYSARLNRANYILINRGIYSKTIRMMIKNSVSASSGRDEISQELILIINESW